MSQTNTYIVNNQVSPHVSDYIQHADENLSDDETTHNNKQRGGSQNYIKLKPSPSITSPRPIRSRYKWVTEGAQSRLSAFFLFSAPVEPAAVAERLTAFVVLGGAGLIPATLALAVLSGEGDVIRSLPSLSLDKDDTDVRSVLAGDDWSGWDGGAGDFRVEDVDGIDSVARGSAGAGVGVDVEGDTAGGVLNSTGLVRGVACTFVINLALEQ